jgi:predicted transglutaminase-like cysteine proteinase
MLKGVMVAGLIILLVGFAGGVWYGHYVWGTDKAQPSYSQMLQEQNELIQQKNEQYAIDIGMTKSEIEALKNYNRNLAETNERLVNEQIENSIKITQLKIQVESKDREIARLKAVKSVPSYSESTDISPVTPVQTAQITTSAGTTYSPAFNYGTWSGRPTYPSIKYYAQVTSNVIKFNEGKSFEQLVNSIRSLQYISHANDNGNYAIQYADETIVKGGGDCTDKVLLLYACLKAQGYDEDKMAVASISDCEGVYNHNVLVMEDPPFDTSSVDSQSVFVLGGRTWYVVDPTNWAGTPVWQMMDYYNDCYRVGNMHFYFVDDYPLDKRSYGWDEMPIHGVEVSR